MRPRRVRRTARRASLVVAAAVGLGLLAQGAASAQEAEPGGGADKVTLCHATGSVDNPYTLITVSVNAVWNKAEENGHAHHDGPIFAPGMTEGWGDIIPPFEYDVERGNNEFDSPFPGMNWPDGQAILANGCEFPVAVDPDEPEDVCPNLEGVQEDVPEGRELVDGECVEIEVAPTDLCPNLEGVQEDVPDGSELVDGECVEIEVAPTDVCPNLEGVQESVPEGLELVEGDCVVIEVAPADLCPNLEGVQTEVPNGFELVDGECVIETVVQDEVLERPVVVEEVVVAQPTTPTVVAGVGGDDTEVLGVVQAAGDAELAVTGPATVPLLVLFGLLNLLFGVQLRRYGRGTRTRS